jgi:hypothetical protein
LISPWLPVQRLLVSALGQGDDGQRTRRASAAEHDGVGTCSECGQHLGRERGIRPGISFVGDHLDVGRLRTLRKRVVHEVAECVGEPDERDGLQPARLHVVDDALDEKRRRLRRVRAESGPVCERVDRQDVDPGNAVVDAVRATHPRGGPKGLREIDEAEIGLVDFVPRDPRTPAVELAARPHILRRIDEDIRLAADVDCKIGGRFFIGRIKRDDLNPLLHAQERVTCKRPPRFGHANEHGVCAGNLQCSDGFLADHAPTVGHEHPPELRIGRHFPPLPVGSLPFGSGKGHGLLALVELK